MSMYLEELSRVQARRRAERVKQKIDMRAGRLIRVAGWNASQTQLRAAAAELPDEQRIEPELLDAAVARAVEMQKDESLRGRRITSQEEAPMERANVDQQTRGKIRAFVRDWRERSDPDAGPRACLNEVVSQFGVKVSYANFHATYWRQAKPSTNGAAPSKEEPAARKVRRPSREMSKRLAARRERKRSASATAAQVADNGAINVQILQLGNGRVSVTLECGKEQLSAFVRALTE